MRIILSIVTILFISSISTVNAQMPYLGFMGNSQRASFNQYQLNDSSHSNKKWFLTSYRSLSASYTFFNGGGASILSAPMGLQLNRRLNNNLYAFAGVSVAPAYINFNQPAFNKNYTGSNLSSSNNFGMYSRAELGLMYVNDQKTFSISGSIGIERSSYPVYYPSNSPQPQPVNRFRQ